MQITNRQASLKHWAIPISLSLLIVVIGARAQDGSIKKIRDFPDGTWLIEIDGVEAWAISDVARVKRLHDSEIDWPQCEADLKKTQENLQEANNNVQQERVRVANLTRDYDAEAKLLNTCMALTGNGPKWSKHWLLDLTLKTAPTVTNFARRCR